MRNGEGIGRVFIPHSALRIPHSAFRIPHSAFRIPHSAFANVQASFTSSPQVPRPFLDIRIHGVIAAEEVSGIKTSFANEQHIVGSDAISENRQ